MGATCIACEGRKAKHEWFINQAKEWHIMESICHYRHIVNTNNYGFKFVFINYVYFFLFAVVKAFIASRLCNLCSFKINNNFITAIVF